MSYKFPQLFSQAERALIHDEAPATGALSVGDGVTKGIPSIAPHVPPQIAASDPPRAARKNTWTDRGGKTIHDAQITAWQGSGELPAPSPDALAAVAEHMAKAEHFERYIAAIRKHLFPRHWERRVGAALNATNQTTGGQSQGLGAGTTGAATVHPGRCLLDFIHNPTTDPVEVHLRELDGDPQSKVIFTIPARGVAPLPAAGLLFSKGITVWYSTGTTTMGGRELD